jgi:transcription termination/antitermination protein NusG
MAYYSGSLAIDEDCIDRDGSDGDLAWCIGLCFFQADYSAGTIAAAGRESVGRKVRVQMDARDQFDQEDEVVSKKPGGRRSSAGSADASLSTPKKPAEKSPEQFSGDEAMSSERSWYVVHCYSGYENKVRHNLEQRIETMGMKGKIFDVVIPTQEEIEVKDGKRRTVERHVFPGYVLVNMVMTEESWYVVRNTPGVTGFVGSGNTPTPLRPEEVAQIMRKMEAEAPRIKVTFRVGERVRIVDGPFNDFRGTVSEIDMERSKVRVMVNFFGRETPVELDFLQVEKS